MSRPEPARPVRTSVVRITAASDALGAVLGLDEDLLTPAEAAVLDRALDLLEELRAGLLEYLR